MRQTAGRLNFRPLLAVDGAHGLLRGRVRGIGSNLRNTCVVRGWKSSEVVQPCPTQWCPLGKKEGLVCYEFTYWLFTSRSVSGYLFQWTTGHPWSNPWVLDGFCTGFHTPNSTQQAPATQTKLRWLRRGLWYAPTVIERSSRSQYVSSVSIWMQLSPLCQASGGSPSQSHRTWPSSSLTVWSAPRCHAHPPWPAAFYGSHLPFRTRLLESVSTCFNRPGMDCQTSLLRL